MLIPELIQLQKGHMEAFDGFYKSTKKSVYFTLKRYIKNEDIIEDLMQDTYMKFLEKLESINPWMNVTGYLTTIAKHKALDYLEKHKHLIYDEHVLLNIAEPQQQDNEDAWDLLNKLDPIRHNIVYLHVIEDMTFKDISITLEKPIGTILWHYHKAMKTLKENYHED
jgi:RNA polymerase sigma-70 factor, ECF subfamily